jgi:hypothetical protein
VMHVLRTNAAGSQDFHDIYTLHVRCISLGVSLYEHSALPYCYDMACSAQAILCPRLAACELALVGCSCAT